MYNGTETINGGHEAFDRPAKSFFGAMAGFIVLDSVLLLCLLNPFAGLAPRTHNYPLVDHAALAASVGIPESAAANKPSPFGSALKPARRRGGADTAIHTAPAFVEVNR